MKLNTSRIHFAVTTAVPDVLTVPLTDPLLGVIDKVDGDP
jgi:hypothetical protein